MIIIIFIFKLLVIGVDNIIEQKILYYLIKKL